MTDAQTSKCEIRLLSEDDVELFFPLRLRALKEEPESFGGSYEESSQLAIADVAKRLHNSEDGFVLGAFIDDLVGVVGFYREKGLKSRHKGVIWGMYVAPEARGKGIGRQLMNAAIARCQTFPGVEQLMLAVVTTREAARNLYVSLGFKTYGVEPRALKLQGRYVDEEMMLLHLDSDQV
jgi:ribosomal protein S18 acetylase RimI-like enzyme